jgi:signal transduction histidine kinase
LQAVLGILKNAADVLIEREIQSPCVMIELYDAGGQCRLSVRDNAGGVPAGLEERIFEPYFSTKDAKNGTGLGLYMAKTLIEQHCQGTLGLENRPAGACFIIELDRDTKDA